jgi:YD repeat-containing protein
MLVAHLTRRIDRRGLVREFQYATLGRNTAEIWYNTVADAEMDANRQNTLSFTHDALGQLTAAADPAASYDYQYDALGRRTSVTHDIAGLGFPVVLASAYDAASNRTSLSATIDTTADFVNQYTYDALHRMTRIEQAGVTGGNAVAEKRIDLSYDAASQWQTITRYADLAATKLVATSDYTFDAAGRLTVLSHAQGATPLAGYSWTYDAAHRVTEFTSLLDGTPTTRTTTDRSIDGRRYTAGAGLPPAPPDEAYGYDANGNRTMTGYATGDNNLVLSDGTYDYEYDAEGNRTRRTHIASGEVTDYDWDHRNRLTQVSIKHHCQRPTDH